MCCFVRFVQIFPWEFLVDEVITEELLSQMLFIVKGELAAETYRKIVLLGCCCCCTTSVH